jgi:hypothetical protein
MNLLRFGRKGLPAAFDGNAPLLWLSPKDALFLADLFPGISVLGQAGSGKTSGLINVAIPLLLLGCGFVWLCAKPEEALLVWRLVKATGRERQFVLFGQEIDRETGGLLVDGNGQPVITGHKVGLLTAVTFHMAKASDGGEHPHFRVLVSERPVDKDGFSKKKWRGLRVGNGKPNSVLMELRREYYRLVNESLAGAGVEGVFYDPEKQPKIPTEPIGKIGHATEGWAKEKADKIREYNRQVGLQNHIDAKVSRAASPEWREKKSEDRRRELQMGRGAAMASRDVAQQALQTTARGRKTTDTAIDRAMHSASWREKEQERGRKNQGRQ